MKRCYMTLSPEFEELNFTFSKLNTHNQGYAMAILRSLIFAQENGVDSPKSGRKSKKKSNSQGVST